MRYLKYNPITTKRTNDPVTVISSLVESSNTNWGHIGFLLIKTGENSSNLSTMVFSYYPTCVIVEPQIHHIPLVEYLV